MINCGVSKLEVEDIVYEIFEEVEMFWLEGVLKSYLYEFLGGMKQWVMIVMELVCDFEFIIVDEFMIVLDVIIEKKVLFIFSKFVEEYNFLVLWIIYDLGVVV